MTERRRGTACSTTGRKGLCVVQSGLSGQRRTAAATAAARILIVAFFAALFAQIASAIAPDPCESAGQAQVLPLPPSVADPIGVRLSVAHTYSSLLPHPEYQYYWFKQTATSADMFVFEVILTNDSTTFPGYTMVGKQDQNWVFIGPLPAGSYKLLGTVNVYDPSTGAISPQCDPMTFGPAQKETDLTVWATDDPVFQKNLQTPESPLVEFYSPSREDYFLTMDPREIQVLDNTPGWKRTGEQFFAFALGAYTPVFTPVNNPFYRFDTMVVRYYGLPSAALNTHFYAFPAEADSLSQSTWMYEVGEAFAIWQPLTSTGICPPNTLPVYRFWDGRPDAHHRWTINPDIRQEMLARGWLPEGYGPDAVIWCSPST